MKKLVAIELNKTRIHEAELTDYTRSFWNYLEKEPAAVGMMLVDGSVVTAIREMDPDEITNKNYQYMVERADGRYLPDFEKLLENAHDDDEKDYILKTETFMAEHNLSFSFNLVNIVKQACGHYEIFQHPANAYHGLAEILTLDNEHASQRCTTCVCNRLA
jgi:hypothetical protein